MKMVDWILTSSVLTALVIALRYALKGKISLRLQYALWALVLLRLLIPVNLFPSSLSILNTLERTEAEPLAAEPRPAEPAGLPVLPIAEETPAASTPAGTADLPKPVAAGEGKAPATAVVPVSAPDKTGFAVNWQKAAWYVWLGGALAVGGWFFGCNLHFCRKLKKTGKPYASQGVRPPVYVTNAAETPCLAGVFRPRIYVTPKVAGNPTQMEHVLTHERTHYYHGDHVWSVLRGICLALHWYNPLVWWAAILSRRDAELACDEATLKRIGDSRRAEYGRTLISVSCNKRPGFLLSAAMMTYGGKSMKERILLIARKPKTAVFTLVVVILIASLFAGCTMTGPKKTPAETSKNPYASREGWPSWPYNYPRDNTPPENEFNKLNLDIKVPDIQGDIPQGAVDTAVKYLDILASRWNYAQKSRLQRAKDWHPERSFPDKYPQLTAASITELVPTARLDTGELLLRIKTKFEMKNADARLDQEGNYVVGEVFDITRDWVFVISPENMEEMYFLVRPTAEAENGWEVSDYMPPRVIERFAAQELLEQYGDKFTAALSELCYPTGLFRDYMLDFYQALSDVFSPPYGAVLTLYVDGKAQNSFLLTDWKLIEDVIAFFPNYEWERTETPRTDNSNIWYAISSPDGTRTVTVWAGEKGPIGYNDHETATYWEASPPHKNFTTIANKFSFVYEDIERDIGRIALEASSPREAIEKFAQVYGTHLTNLNPDNAYAIDRFQVVKTQALQISTDQNLVLGRFEMAVEPKSEFLVSRFDEFMKGRNIILWEGSVQKGAGEYDGMLVFTREFLLEKQANGQWRCIDFGESGLTLPKSN